MLNSRNRNKICPHWQRGNCRHGNRCWYKHACGNNNNNQRTGTKNFVFTPHHESNSKSGKKFYYQHICVGNNTFVSKSSEELRLEDQFQQLEAPDKTTNNLWNNSWPWTTKTASFGWGSYNNNNVSNTNNSSNNNNNSSSSRVSNLECKEEKKEEESQEHTQSAPHTTISGLSTDKCIKTSAKRSPYGAVLDAMELQNELRMEDKDRQIKEQKQQIDELNQTKSAFIVELQKQLQAANKLNVVLTQNMDKCLSDMRELRHEMQNMNKQNKQIVTGKELTIIGLQNTITGLAKQVAELKALQHQSPSSSPPQPHAANVVENFSFGTISPNRNEHTMPNAEEKKQEEPHEHTQTAPYRPETQATRATISGATATVQSTLETTRGLSTSFDAKDTEEKPFSFDVNNGDKGNSEWADGFKQNDDANVTDDPYQGWTQNEIAMEKQRQNEIVVDKENQGQTWQMPGDLFQFDSGNKDNTNAFANLDLEQQKGVDLEAGKVMNRIQTDSNDADKSSNVQQDLSNTSSGWQWGNLSGEFSSVKVTEGFGNATWGYDGGGFGSFGDSAGFSMDALMKDTDAESGLKKVEQDEDNGNYTLKPIVSLEEVDVETGHDNESELESFPIAKLYRWGKDVSQQPCWKQRASKTSITFYQHNLTGKTRMVCRENITNKLRLNQNVATSVIVSMSKKTEKQIIWTGEDENDAQGMFIAKFIEEDTAEAFHNMFASFAQNGENLPTNATVESQMAMS